MVRFTVLRREGIGSVAVHLDQGKYFDESSSEVICTLLVFNAELNTITLVEPSFSAQMAASPWKVPFVELIWPFIAIISVGQGCGLPRNLGAICVFVDISGEVRQFQQMKRENGRWYSYFIDDRWNILDMVNHVLFIAQIISWCYFVSTYMLDISLSRADGHHQKLYKHGCLLKVDENSFEQS